MNNSWSKSRLENVATFISRGKSPNYVENSHIKVLNQRAIRWGYIDRASLKYHDPRYSIKDDFFIRKGDIVLNSTGDITIGRAFYFKDVNEKLLADSHVTIIRLNKKIMLPEFLIQLFPLKAYQTKIYNIVTGATGQLELTKNNLQKLEIDVPPIPIQQKIAAILSAYDDLIETNNRRIAILEEMAQEIYKEWFVRMRFPGWESTVFKKGIPMDWNIRAIKEFGTVVTGKTPSTKYSKYYGGTIPFIKTPDMHNNIFIYKTEETLTEAGLNSQKQQTIVKNSICVNCIGAKSGSVSITTKTSQTNQQIHSLILNDLTNLEFLFFAFRGLKETIHLFGAIGATMTNLSKGKFESLNILYPGVIQIKNFHKLICPLFKELELLILTNNNLRQTRDLLLPRLISGKLSVENAAIEFNQH